MAVANDKCSLAHVILLFSKAAAYQKVVFGDTVGWQFLGSNFLLKECLRPLLVAEFVVQLISRGAGISTQLQNIYARP